MSQVIFQQNEIAYLRLMDEFNTAYQQYSLTQSKVSTLEKLKSKLQQAEQKLKFMQIEFKSCESTLKAELTPKMKQHQMNYANSQQKLKSIEQSKSVEQTQPSFNLDTRKRIENNTNQLETQTNQLENYNKTLTNTVELQDGIMVDLKKQKEKLLIAQEDTNIIRSDVKETGRYVRIMQNRELFSKVLKLGLIGVLTLGNILLIYYKI
ncbi:unnamed protein product [Paramecium pentaurelia]|uniref:t-SNARE coiled-coil homology domain-containing protein n=1 Tax=Paramecium pentaurelia TaxID=43138 RepID=A0A8S1YFA4_9CILI|nr:unnamed protein product [Paramecium pentaurelia]